MNGKRGASMKRWLFDRGGGNFFDQHANGWEISQKRGTVVKLVERSGGFLYSHKI